jgi:aldehyde:ferredoxin oxidoreductase
MECPKEPELPAEMLVKIMASKLRPYEFDPRMLDCSTENRYSEHMAKTVAWQKHYNRFWKHSLLLCDQKFPNLLSPNTFELEPAFWAAVTGKKMDFLEGMSLGKKIWDLENAIWTLQGRRKDIVHFAEYVYKVPYPKGGFPGSVGRNEYGSSYYLPGLKDGKWQYINMDGRHHDKEEFDEFKGKVYQLWDWDTATGWPKRSALEAEGLKAVADELEKHGKLGLENQSSAEGANA